MVDATLNIAIQKLDAFLTQEYEIRRGVKDGVRWLKDELGYLQSSVRAAEAKQDEELIRIWIDNVKEVANDVILILERFIALQEEHEAAKQGTTTKAIILERLSFICMCLISMCQEKDDLYDIGNQIKSLKERVVEIKKRQDQFGITNTLANPMVQKRKRTLLRATSFENKVDVVGFEDDAKTLLAELVKKDPFLKVISIHGMGGLGKTTLASKLYYSSELSHFQSRAWVCVSEEYEIRDVLIKMIKSFMRDEHKLDFLKMDEVDLRHQLQKLLQEPDRAFYLAVIDDIWDLEAWENIKKAFPDNKNGSRVIITTRNKNVAERVDDKCCVHKLRFLRKDESRQLFCKRANPTQNLQKLGEEMVDKCGGLPLAIVVLSGLLLHRKSYGDWLKVKEHIWRHLKGDSVEIQEILSLSYHDLSFHMRQCFLYLARFPEDHYFEVSNLKLLWIAEEFISEAEEGDGVVMEDVAEDYLNELVNRNMIQIERLFWDGQVYRCRVHDLVRDLAIQKATTDKLLGIFDSNKEHSSSVRLLQGQPRHAIYNGIGEYLKLCGPSSDALKLRSLAVIKASGRLEKEEMKKLYTRFKYLKVLDLRSVISDTIPEEIGDLVLLKFLGLMGSISEQDLTIPATIRKLKKLQTFRGSSNLGYEFPREICELKELRHLIFGDYNGTLNISSHQTKLQTLGNIWFKEWIHFDIVNLTNLRTLSIIHEEEEEEEEEMAYNLDSIANLTSLQTFTLKFFFGVFPTIKSLSYCKRLKQVTLMGTIRDPAELSFLPDSVTNLALHGTSFAQDLMPTLGNLSNLTILHLCNGYMGKKMVCSRDAFPSLQFLRLKDLRNLEEWQVEDGGLPSLKGLNIIDCTKLKMIPESVKCIPPIPAMFATWYD